MAAPKKDFKGKLLGLQKRIEEGKEAIQEEPIQKTDEKVVLKDGNWSIEETSTSKNDAGNQETAPKQKKEMFKTPVAKQTGKLTRKADSTAPPSEKRTFIIQDDLMEKIYLIKYWSRCDTLSEIINEALQLKIDKYEKENGILYPPPQ